MANAAKDIGGTAVAGGTAGAAGGPLGIAIGAGLGALAGLIGYLIESGHEEEANQILATARNKYGSLDDSAVKKAAGEVLGPTNLAKIQADPHYRAVQDDALAQLSHQSRTGLSLSDKANLADSMDSAGQEAKHSREAIQSNFAQRGMGGSANEFASALEGQQEGANRASQNARHIAGDSADRALRALSQSAQMAGGLESTDYNRQADVAKEQDSIDRFNNVTQYNRAADQYGRDLGKLDRNYNMAQDAAGQERATGQRQGQVAAGVGNELAKGLERMPMGTYGDNAAPNDPNRTPYVKPNTTENLSPAVVAPLPKNDEDPPGNWK